MPTSSSLSCTWPRAPTSWMSCRWRSNSRRTCTCLACKVLERCFDVVRCLRLGQELQQLVLLRLMRMWQKPRWGCCRIAFCLSLQRLYLAGFAGFIMPWDWSGLELNDSRVQGQGESTAQVERLRTDWRRPVWRFYTSETPNIRSLIHCLEPTFSKLAQSLALWIPKVPSSEASMSRQWHCWLIIGRVMCQSAAWYALLGGTLVSDSWRLAVSVSQGTSRIRPAFIWRIPLFILWTFEVPGGPRGVKYLDRECMDGEVDQ
jgi:hypothetical protein